MSQKKAQFNDIGTVFKVIVVDADGVIMDLSVATSLQVCFKSPTGTLKVKTAVLYSDGTDGAMKYVSIDGDLDEVGRWKLQGRVTLPAGAWSTKVGRFRVLRNICS